MKFIPPYLANTTLLSEQFQIAVPLVTDSSVSSEIDEICIAFNRKVRNIHVESIHASGVVERLRKCISSASHRRNMKMIRLNRERIEKFRRLRQGKKVYPVSSSFDAERLAFPSQNLSELDRSSNFVCDGCSEEHSIKSQRYNRVGHDFDICQSHYLSLSLSERKEYRRADSGETYRLRPLRSLSFMPQQIVKSSSMSSRRGVSLVTRVSRIQAPVLPPVSYVPSASAWICLTRNIHAEDEPVLRYVPYFGDEAGDNTLDVSYFEILPTELNGQEKISEVDESIAMVCSTRWSNADDLFIDYMCKGRGFKVTDLVDRVKTRLSNMAKWRALFPESFGKESFRARISDWRRTLLNLERDVFGVDLSSSIETSLSVPSVLSSSGWSSLLDQTPSRSNESSKCFPMEIRVASHPDVSYVGIYVRQLDMLNGKYWYKYRDNKSGRHRRLYFCNKDERPMCWCLSDHMNEMGGWIKPDNFTTSTIPFGSRRWNDICGDGLVHLIPIEKTSQFNEILNGLRVMMESYRLLFCRRCFKFDCSIHGTQQPLTGTVGSPPSRPTKPSKDLLPSDHPLRSLDDLRRSSSPSPSCCNSLYCHKNVSDQEERMPKRRKKRDWNSREMLILLKSASVFAKIPIDPKMSCLDVVLRRDCVCSVARCLPQFYCMEVKRKIEELALMYGSANGALAKKDMLSTNQRKVSKSNNNEGPTAKLLRLKRVMSKPGYNTKLYQPCFHPGEPCTKANCQCVQNNVFCEKWCGCAPGCDKAFPGCKCKQGRCRSAACICFNAGRECDPDICMHCDVHLHPDEIVGERRCGNADIHYRNHGKLGLSASKIHGWGVFALQPFKKGEFIYEYIGEILSQNEADRRGKIYDQLNRSFLFNLNEFQVVDATRKGNKMKFANHSDTPNCRPLIRLTGGDHKIAIFAKRDIEVGEEICFDYRYNEDHAQVHFEKKKIAFV